ncbi:hypothetical protein V8C42DRAFT_336072 [Trichoderma barbatum]
MPAVSLFRERQGSSSPDMFSQRHSCDRCRQHEVRCLKYWEVQADIGGGEHLATCERCAKADVPCVYSVKQKRKQFSFTRKDAMVTPPVTAMSYSQDLAGMVSTSDGLGSLLGDMTMPLLDMTETTMPGYDDNDQYALNSETSQSSMPAALLASDRDYGMGTQSSSAEDNGPFRKKDAGTAGTLIGQVMTVSSRATQAAHRLDCADMTMSVTVNSPVVNEAFEVANTLTRILKDTMENSTSASTRQVPRDNNQSSISSGLVFLVLAAHQHTLDLFRAICNFIQRSLDATDRQNEAQQQDLHSDGIYSAQFVMILQLIMHLTNRLSQSLGIENTARAGADGEVSGTKLCQSQQLTPGIEGERESSPPSVLQLAQGILKQLPRQHVNMKEVIQDLQARTEERCYIR